MAGDKLTWKSHTTKWSILMNKSQMREKEDGVRLYLVSYIFRICGRKRLQEEKQCRGGGMRMEPCQTGCFQTDPLESDLTDPFSDTFRLTSPLTVLPSVTEAGMWDSGQTRWCLKPDK